MGMLLFLPGTGRGTVRRTVEGNARRAGLHDVLDDGVHVGEYLPRRNTQRSDVAGRQPCIALDISRRSIADIVTLAINFDGQTTLGAEEIEHIGTGRMLPSKFEATGPRSQHPPQYSFGQAQRSPQPSRAFNRLPRTSEHAAFPSTMLRMVPLPVPGRNYSRNGALS